MMHVNPESQVEIWGWKGSDVTHGQDSDVSHEGIRPQCTAYFAYLAPEVLRSIPSFLLLPVTADAIIVFLLKQIFGSDLLDDLEQQPRGWQVETVLRGGCSIWQWLREGPAAKCPGSASASSCASPKMARPETIEKGNAR